MGLVCAIAWKHAREVRNAQKILVFILVFVKMVIKVYLEGVYYSFAKSFFGGMARRHRAISAYAEASFRLRAGRRSKPACAVGRSGHHIKPTLREVYPAFKREAFHFPACRSGSAGRYPLPKSIHFTKVSFPGSPKQHTIGNVVYCCSFYFGLPESQK